MSAALGTGGELSSSSLEARARGAVRLVGIGGVTGAVYGTYLAERRLHEISDERRDAYLHRWAAAQLRLFGVRLHLLGDIPAAAGPRLVVCNHRSALDIVITLHLFAGHILARGDMATWPGVGPMIRAAGTLFVDREETMSRAAAIRRVSERLRGGRTVIVFPEGTTYPGDEVRPFQAGAFLPLLRGGGAVLPLGLAYAREESHYGDEAFTGHLLRLLRLPCSEVAVAVGAPITAAGQRPAALAEQSRAAVQALVGQARQALAARASARPSDRAAR